MRTGKISSKQTQLLRQAALVLAGSAAERSSVVHRGVPKPGKLWGAGRPTESPLLTPQQLAGPGQG